MTSLILMSWVQTLSNVVIGVAIGVLLSLFFGHKVYQQEIGLFKEQMEEHSLCKDTKNKTAWVARRQGELRCFLENDDFPHRAWGSNIE